MTRPRVLIVGAGFAGFHCAREERLLGQPEAELTLASPVDYMLYSPLLPHVLAELELGNAVGDERRRAAHCTFVVAGAGYAGVETAAALHLFTRRLLPRFINLRPQDLRWVLADVAPRILPELGGKLSAAALALLRRCGIEVRLGTGIAQINESVVGLTGGAAAVPDLTGDRDAITPPTAQHAQRQGITVARPLGRHLSGIPAQVVTRRYHLYALPSPRARIRTAADWLMHAALGDDFTRLGLPDPMSGALAGQEPAGQYMSRDDARQETARILAHDQGGWLT